MIDDHSATAKVGVKGGKTDIAIGSYEKSTIDIFDIKQFDNMGKGAATKQGKLIHELSEQFGKAKGMDYEGAHERGKNSENKVNGSKRGAETNARNITTQEYTKKGQTTKYSYKSNVPIIEVYKSYK